MLIVADWYRSPEEVGSSYFAKYLKGAVVAPNVLMTCSSTAEGGGRVLDFGLASSDIAGKIQCEANYKVPFKPHFVGLDFSIDLGYVADTGQQLVIPTDLKFCQGPRLPEHSWARLFHEALGDQLQLDFPCGKDAHPVATDLLARFSNAAERFTMAVDPGAE